MYDVICGNVCSWVFFMVYIVSFDLVLFFMIWMVLLERRLNGNWCPIVYMWYISLPIVKFSCFWVWLFLHLRVWNIIFIFHGIRSDQFFKVWFILLNFDICDFDIFFSLVLFPWSGYIEESYYSEFSTNYFIFFVYL